MLPPKKAVRVRGGVACRHQAGAVSPRRRGKPVQAEGSSEVQATWLPIAGDLGSACGHQELLVGHPDLADVEPQAPGRPRLSSSFGPWGPHSGQRENVWSRAEAGRPDGEAQSKMSVSNGTRW